jgi:hypothetical protein
MVLVVFAPDFKVALWVIANRTFLRCLSAFENVSAVPALPFDGCISLEYLALFYIC